MEELLLVDDNPKNTVRFEELNLDRHLVVVWTPTEIATLRIKSLTPDRREYQFVGLWGDVIWSGNTLKECIEDVRSEGYKVSVYINKNQERLQ